MPYSIEQILEAAASHLFYSHHVSSSERSLSAFPLMVKTELHDNIQTTILSDPNFLKSAYISLTGGSSGVTSGPCFFVVDAAENRRQRQKAGEFMRSLHAIDENDVVLNLHAGGGMYRSLELTGDLVEYAGGTNIPAGSNFPDKEIAQIVGQFGVNVITGISSRLLIFARYLLANPTIEISFTKVMYSSEPLPAYQEEYLRKAFRCEYIVSVFGSAECGPWAVSVPSNSLNDEKPYRDLIFETDTMIVEIVDDNGNPMPEGEVGEIIVTSLMRLRNPLVRFRSGDIGSLHPHTTDGVGAGEHRCLRLYGRHPGKSFHLNGEKFSVIDIEKVMRQEQWGVLEWQVILDSDHVGQREESVEFRVVFKDKAAGEALSEDIKAALLKGNGPYITADFIVKAVEYVDLEKGSNANKIRKIVDRR